MPYTTFDCDTEEGQVYTESEYAVAERIGKSKNLHPFRFGKGSRIDRMFYDDDGKVPMLCEIRTRNKSLKDLCDYQSVLCNEKGWNEFTSRKYMDACATKGCIHKPSSDSGLCFKCYALSRTDGY